MNLSKLFGLVAGVVLAGFLLSYGVTQEVPIGAVDGNVTMQENGKPLPEALVTFTPLSEIDKEVIRPRYAYTKEDGSFSIRNLPAGAYEVEISAEHHNMKARFEWIEEGTTLSMGNLKLKPIPPYVNLYASQRVFTPQEQPHIEMHGFTPANKMDVSIMRLDLQHLAREGGLDSALYRLTNEPKVPAGAGKVISETQHEVSRRDVEGAFIEPVKLPKLQSGFYLVRVNDGATARAATYLNITDIAMVTKSVDGRALAFVTDITSGRAVQGAQVQVLRNGQLASAGVTGADGLVETTYVSNSNRPVLVARRGDSTALVGFYGYQNNESNHRIVAYTDRPIYRPGDEVQFKGIIRKLTGNDYVLPGPGNAVVDFLNPEGDVVESVTTPVSSNGTIHGSFTTNPEMEPSEYWRLRIKAFGAEEQHSFPISAYRKPEYTVEVRPTKPFFMLGESASAKVHCEYYFGGPVIGAKVKAYIYRNPFYRYESEEGEEYYDDQRFTGGEFSEEIEAVTDANGDATLVFDTRAKGDPLDFPTDFEYTIVASVADEGDKYFDGQGSVLVVRGDYDLTVETNRYIVAPGDSFKIDLSTIGHDDKPRGNRKVQVTVGREEWTSRTSLFVPEKTYEATTDQEGNATLDVAATKAGSMKIVAVSTDQDGRKIVSESYLWVDGPNAGWFPDMGDLRVTLDKKSYTPGETATVLLQTEKPGGHALITVQADRILYQSVVLLSESSQTISLPIQGEFAPNAYVTAAYVKEKKFLSASRRLNIERPDRNLTVEITSNERDYEPGETAEIAVLTRDHNGQPVPAELSLGVVDESIYAIRSDSTNIGRELYPTRYDRVTTSYSFPEVYLDGGDKGSGEIPLRSKFKDTAFWQPVVQTDASGRATVRFELPDNLTQWRATAIGVTDASAAGMTTTKFRARKDLMVRLQPPQYMVQQDTQRMTVVVTNDTGQDQNVNVRVEAEGVAMEGRAEQTVRVRAGRPEAMEFTLSAKDAGTAKLTARAWVQNGASDGVTQSFSIAPHGRMDFEARSGVAQGSATESVTLQNDALTSMGELTVTLSPSLAGGLVETLPGLIGYPYGCVEQTMSRFMPAVLVRQVLRQSGQPMPEIERQLPQIVEQGYTRLGKLQQYEGGFGWWEHGDPDPFMTALVMDGIDRARQAGYPPRYVNMGRLVESAQRLVKARPTEEWRRRSWERDRVYLSYVLARYGKRADAEAGLKGFEVAKAGTSELALAALAAHELGLTSLQNAAMDRLMTLAAVGSINASWSPQDYAWGQEPTALALTALLQVRQEDPIIPKVVRYLMTEKQGDLWTSTRDTAYSLVALTRYLAQNPAEVANQTDVKVTLNGRQIGSAQLDTANPNGSTITVPASELRQGGNEVRVETASGLCFYTVQLKQFRVAQVLPAQPGDGLTITRKYFVLAPRRAQDGTMRLLPSERTIDKIQSGELVRVELTLNTNVPREFLMIEDPVPSNFRVTERIETDRYDWRWWWDKTVIRDDRISFFARWLPQGESKITYTMRAESPGIGNGLPTVTENMYDPSQRASDASTRIEVTR